MSNNHPFQLMTDQMRQDAYEVNMVKGISYQVTDEGSEMQVLPWCNRDDKMVQTIYIE